MEIKKPENYQPGARENLKNGSKSLTVPLILFLTVSVWLLSSIWVTVEDIFNGYNHTVLSTSFIVSVVTVTSGVVLGYVRKKGHRVKLPKVKPCTKCGNNKSK